MLLYHGSNIIVTEPEIRQSIRGLDFGEGFYLSASEDQGRKFGFIVRNRAIKYHKEPVGVPTVNVFEFDKEGFDTLIIRMFPKADGEWLSFIHENRRKAYAGESYDLCVGPTANDDVFATIQLFESGVLDFDGAIQALKAYKLQDQYCFKTPKALGYLRYLRSYTMEG
jgi:hypothetical protein